MGAKHMARKLGGAVCLAVAAVSHGEDGGDWRDRVTIITSERLRGEIVDLSIPSTGENTDGLLAPRFGGGTNAASTHGRPSYRYAPDRRGSMWRTCSP
jgi:hypothetical protein